MRQGPPLTGLKHLASPFCNVRTLENLVYEPESGCQTDTKSVNALILDLLAFWSCENKLLLFISHVVYDVLL